MEAIEFIINYGSYLDEIQSVIKPELYHIIDQLREINPHNLVRPETWVQDEDYAKGYVWSMFVKRSSAYLPGHP